MKTQVFLLLLIFSFNFAFGEAKLECVEESKPFKTEAVGECPDCAKVTDREISKLFEAARNIRLDADSKSGKRDLKSFNNALGEYYNSFGLSSKTSSNALITTYTPFIEQAESNLKEHKKSLAFSKACLSGNYKSTVRDNYMATASEVKGVYLSFEQYFDEDQLNILEKLDPDQYKTPSRKTFQTICYGFCVYSQGPECDRRQLSDFWNKTRELTVSAMKALEEQLKIYRIQEKEEIEALKKEKEQKKVHQEVATVAPDRANIPVTQQCGLLKEEVLAIKYYTADGYKCINSILRGQKDKCPHELLPAVPSYVRIFNSALSKLNPYEGDVYRGASFLPDDLIAAHQEGAIVRFSSYLSTSVEEVNAKFFGGNFLYKIKHKTGVQVSQLSAHTTEMEIIFQPNTAFKILKVEKQGYTTVFSMEEI